MSLLGPAACCCARWSWNWTGSSGPLPPVRSEGAASERSRGASENLRLVGLCSAREGNGARCVFVRAEQAGRVVVVGGSGSVSGGLRGDPSRSTSGVRRKPAPCFSCHSHAGSRLMRSSEAFGASLWNRGTIAARGGSTFESNCGARRGRAFEFPGGRIVPLRSFITAEGDKAEKFENGDGSEKQLHRHDNSRVRPEIHGFRVRPGRPPPLGPYDNVLLQGFNWESHKQHWWVSLKAKAEEICSIGVTDVWLPPVSKSVDRQGYLPTELYNLDASSYGTGSELKELIDELHRHKIFCIADIVINHRSGVKQDNKGHWNIFKGGNRDKRLDWGPWAVVDDDVYDSGGKGKHDTGESYGAAPDLDHTNKQVQDELSDWMNWLRAEVGFDGWRFDFVKGYAAKYTQIYCQRTNPSFAVGELWTSMEYWNGQLSFDQNKHRQIIVDWIDGTQGTCSAFDFTTKGILQRAVEGQGEYWRLSDAGGKPPGVIGWYPQKAVTFLDNHDTGSTQRHWNFPDKQVLQGYAYILTHPGFPCIFYDHIFEYKLKSEIRKLVKLRKRNRINARSQVTIQKAEADLYVAKIDDRVILKLGPRFDLGDLLPDKSSWAMVLSGPNFAVWESTKPLPPLPATADVQPPPKNTLEHRPVQPIRLTDKMSQETRRRILQEVPGLVDPGR